MYNPYAPPHTDPIAAPGTWPMPDAGPVTAGILRSMRQTRPWVRFLSILGFIIAGLIALGGASATVVGPMGGVFGLVYLFSAGLYLLPSLFLHRYASGIGQLIQVRDQRALEAALDAQKSFWRFTGIVTASFLVLYGLALCGGAAYMLKSLG